MATGQDLLDLMELLHPELQVQPGEAGVTRALRALNAAQDQFEARLALVPEVLGSQTGTVQTAANTETTPFPAGLLRIDRLQLLDAATNRPIWDLEPLAGAGRHAPSRSWPLLTLGSTGRPRAYWTDGRAIYWDPLPDAVHTVRWYGLQAAADLTATSSVSYPDICLLPLATYAVRLLRLGLDDDTRDLVGLAEELFDPVLRALGSFRREQARAYVYQYGHET